MSPHDPRPVSIPLDQTEKELSEHTLILHALSRATPELQLLGQSIDVLSAVDRIVQRLRLSAVQIEQHRKKADDRDVKVWKWREDLGAKKGESTSDAIQRVMGELRDLRRNRPVSSVLPLRIDDGSMIEVESIQGGAKTPNTKLPVSLVLLRTMAYGRRYRQQFNAFGPATLEPKEPVLAGQPVTGMVIDEVSQPLGSAQQNGLLSDVEYALDAAGVERIGNGHAGPVMLTPAGRVRMLVDSRTASERELATAKNALAVAQAAAGEHHAAHVRMVEAGVPEGPFESRVAHLIQERSLLIDVRTAIQHSKVHGSALPTVLPHQSVIELTKQRDGAWAENDRLSNKIADGAGIDRHRVGNALVEALRCLAPNKLIPYRLEERADAVLEAAKQVGANPARQRFERELSSAVNRCSMENGSNTPDFILAALLADCAQAFDAAARRRDDYYRVKVHPTAGAVVHGGGGQAGAPGVPNPTNLAGPGPVCGGA